MSTPYRTCPECGSNLDPGERCTCSEKREAAPEATEEAGQQATVNPHEPVLAPGA